MRTGSSIPHVTRARLEFQSTRSQSAQNERESPPRQKQQNRKSQELSASCLLRSGWWTNCAYWWLVCRFLNWCVENSYVTNWTTLSVHSTHIIRYPQSSILSAKIRRSSDMIFDVRFLMHWARTFLLKSTPVFGIVSQTKKELCRKRLLCASTGSNARPLYSLAEVRNISIHCSWTNVVVAVNVDMLGEYALLNSRKYGCSPLKWDTRI